MSFIGKLEELPVPDLLQIIAANGKSGKLNLTRHDAQGIIVFRDGKIIYAATTSARETLGHLLLTEGLLTEDQLLAALEQQHRSSSEQRLGTILLEHGSLSLDQLTRAVQQQTGKVIAEFLGWSTGFFKFDSLDLPDRGEIGVDAEDFLLERGLTPDTVLLDFTAKLAALDTDTAAADAGSETASADESPSSLKAVMAEISSPEFTGEVGLTILSYAKSILPRSLLFFVRQGAFVGLGKRDRNLPDDHTNLARIKIPCDAPSILAEAAGHRAALRGTLDDNEGNLQLVAKLGGAPPKEAAALPMIVNQRVLLVLYGDTADGDAPLPALDQLELLVQQAGLAMEKRLLEKRFEQVGELRTEA